MLMVPTLFSLVHLSSRLCFLKIILFLGFWSNICGERSEHRLPLGEKAWWWCSCSKGVGCRNGTWLPDVITVRYYLTFLASFHMFHLFSHLLHEVILKLSYLPHKMHMPAPQFRRILNSHCKVKFIWITNLQTKQEHGTFGFSGS